MLKNKVGGNGNDEGFVAVMQVGNQRAWRKGGRGCIENGASLGGINEVETAGMHS